MLHCLYIPTQTTGDVAEQYHAHLFMSRHQIRQGNYKEAEIHAHQACQFDAVSSSNKYSNTVLNICFKDTHVHSM